MQLKIFFYTCSNIPNKLINYVEQVETINKLNNIAEEKIKIIKKGLHKMDEIIKHVNGIEERVFRLYYIENKYPTQISFIIPCDRATVYKYIKKIKQKI